MKGPKGILAEAISNALAEYFVIDQKNMETKLLSNALTAPKDNFWVPMWSLCSNISLKLTLNDGSFVFQAEKKGLVMVNFFSYFLTCTNHSTVNDVIGESNFGRWCPYITM